MAGAVRQPIDIQSLERFISQNVPEIKVPIDVKQVIINPSSFCTAVSISNPLTTVWLWTIEPDVSAHSKRWPEIRDAQEAAWKTAVENCASG